MIGNWLETLLGVDALSLSLSLSLSFLGSGPEGGDALYNRGDFVRTSFRPSVRPPPTKPEGPQARPQEPQAGPLGP